MKKLIAFHIIIGLLTVVSPVVAAPPTLVSATVVPSGRSVTIPGTAVEVADNVFDLGTATDPASGAPVQGYAIVHHRKGETRAIGASHTSKNKCYTYLARGAKWRTVEPWVVNPANIRGLANDFVVGTLGAGIAKWEDAADGLVGNASGVNILGDGTITSGLLSADTSTPDGANEVYFADVAEPNAIAITIVWYTLVGKTLVEWDQVYDHVSYDWSATGEPGKMDFDNIVTHELGHSAGLGDLYNSCTEETMFGYADYGEIKKRDLGIGDIAGINALY